MSMRVVRMRAVENEVLLDREVMESMREAVGREVFDEIFEDAIFEITDRLYRLEALARADNLDAMARVAHDLVAVAGQIGLSGVSEIAANLEFCCNDGDQIAAQAVAARLIRAGEESLVAAAELSVEVSVQRSDAAVS